MVLTVHRNQKAYRGRGEGGEGGMEVVSKQTSCLTSTESIRLFRDGEKGGGGMEVGEEGDCIPHRYTVTTRIISH